ncbi:MAG: hypothetical protein HC884_17815 [Chloroflexaceae bacterium]|nr:hypothetical protein [Chloroflexaceae bacterium]
MGGFLVSDYLQTLFPYVPEALVSRQCLEQMHAIGELLPGALTDFFGFECRLGTPDQTADFLLCVEVVDRQREVLAGLRPGIDLSPTLLEHPVWQQIRNFSLTWADPASVLHEKALNVWLEFDMAELEGSRLALPVPSAFLGSRHICNTATPNEAHQHTWITRTALPLLTGQHLPEPVENRLIEAIQRLPAGPHIFQLGAMVARKPPFVRICITRMDPQQVPPYLEAIGWPGTTDELGRLVEELDGLVDRIDVDLDISEQISPRVGLECSFDPKQSPEYEPRWYPFLAYLVEKSLCTSDKRDALLRYSGFAHEQSDPDRWPAALRKASKLMGSQFLSIITRGLNHVKIVYQSGRPLEAKAYLYVNHFWLSPAKLRQSGQALARPREIGAK